MGGIKFFDLFRSLDKKELSAFGKYLRTTHANKKIAQEVFGHLRKAHPVHGSRKPWDDDQLATRVFRSGQTEKIRKQLHNTYHDLYLYLRGYLILQKVNDDSLESEWLWLSILHRRNEKGYAKASKRFFSKIYAETKLDTIDYLRDIAARYFDYKDSKESDVAKLADLSNSLDAFYQVCRNKVDCELLNRQLQEGHKMGLNTEPPKSGLPLLSDNYRKIKGLFATADDRLYQQLKDILYKQTVFISTAELKTIWTYLKNYCAMRIREGEKKFFRQAFELDVFASGHDFFLKKGETMSTSNLLNVISTAAVVKEFEWGRSFLKKHIRHIEEDIRYESKLVVSAILFFKEGNFLEALGELEKFRDYRSKDEGIEIVRRAYALMTMYELGEDEVAQLMFLNSFRSFLDRSSSPRQKAVRATKKFLQILKYLICRNKKKDRLTKEIEAAKPCVYKNWLRMKLADYTPVQ